MAHSATPEFWMDNRTTTFLFDEAGSRGLARPTLERVLRKSHDAPHLITRRITPIPYQSYMTDTLIVAAARFLRGCVVGRVSALLCRWPGVPSPAAANISPI
jgi:hypothetical protein